MTDYWDDIGGGYNPADPYTVAKQWDCPRCGAQARQACVNPLTGEAAHMACMARKARPARVEAK